MAACSTNYYEYFVKDNGGGTYDYYIWRKSNKTVTIETRNTIPSGHFPITNGEIIDIKQDGDYAYAVTIDYSDPTNNYLNYVLLASTGGDTRNLIMSTVRSVGTYTVKLYALGLKEQTTIIYTLQTAYTAPVDGYPAEGYVYTPGAGTNTPCVNSDSYVHTINTCDGYTRKTVFINGSSLTNSEELNSTLCGYAEAQTVGFQISETLRFKVEDACVNPVYICWLNTLGGWDQWLFSGSQDIDLGVSGESSFLENYTFSEDTTNPLVNLKKQAGERMRLGANALTTNEKEALKEILYSPAVYIVASDLTIEKRVNVSTGTFRVRRTSSNLHDIEFEIILPDIQTIGN